MKKIVFSLLCLLLFACKGEMRQEKIDIIKDIPVQAPQLSAAVKLSPEAYATKVVVEFNGSKVKLSQLPAGVTAEVAGANVQLRSSVQGVEYLLCGTTDKGSFLLQSEFSPLLTLDSVDIHSVGRDAFTVSSKEKIFIRGSVATFTDEFVSSAVTDKLASTVSLLGDAVFCGGVDICLQATRRDAVRSTGILYVDSARIMVDYAAASAFNVIKGFVFACGELHATALKNVLKVKQGNFVMLGGTVTAGTAADKADAIAARNIYIYDGALIVDVQGAAAKGLKSKESVFLLGGELKVHTSGGALYAEKKGDYSSSSCIKSGVNTYMNNANVALVSEGDAGKGINCDGLLQIDGGLLSVMTTGCDVNHPIDLNAHASAKGIKCDSTILVNGGKIEVLVYGKGERSEGVESKDDIIVAGDGAELYVYAYDDAINTGGDFILNAGRVFVYSASNDGVDSNAKISINGGMLIANGSHTPEQGVDCDFEQNFTVRGGTLLSLGGSFGPSPVLPKNRNSKSAVVAWCGVEAPKGRFFNVADEDGEVLLSYCLPRSLNNASLVVSSPSMLKGGEFSMFMSDTVTGGSPVGCGLYLAGKAQVVGDVVTWQQGGLLAVIDKNGESRFINPDTIKAVGNKLPGGFPAPPPPGFNPFEGGKIPPPPPGGFEPLGGVMENGELPSEGWR